MYLFHKLLSETYSLFLSNIALGSMNEDSEFFMCLLNQTRIFCHAIESSGCVRKQIVWWVKLFYFSSIKNQNS